MVLVRGLTQSVIITYDTQVHWPYMCHCHQWIHQVRAATGVPTRVWCWSQLPLIARFMGPTWDPSGADRTQVGPMLAPWTWLSGYSSWHKPLVNSFIILMIVWHNRRKFGMVQIEHDFMYIFFYLGLYNEIIKQMYLLNIMALVVMNLLVMSVCYTSYHYHHERLMNC